MSVLERPRGQIASLRRRYEPKIAALRNSDTAKAAGLALAMIANNVIALGSTIVFARLLTDYGSLAALVSYFLILSVAGQAIQVATAREGVLGRLGVGPGLLATLKRWTWSLLWVTIAMTVVAILLRQPTADVVGVRKDPWAAAIGLPAGCLWLELCFLRGALQGVGDYKSVGMSLIGEQSTRLVTGAALALAGLGVTGAYLGTPISFIVMGLYCARALRRHVEGLAVAEPARRASEAVEAMALHPEPAPAPAPAPVPATGLERAPAAAGVAVAPAPVAAAPSPSPAAAVSLWTHVKRAWAPIAGLIVIAVLQNIDLIAAKHRLSGSIDNSYAATAVAAKVLIWVAIGAGFYLVPEVSRRRANGEDTRPVLAAALGIILVCAIPVLLIFAFAAKPLLRLGFGSNHLKAADSLLVLGVAFTVLAGTYLAVQYMLALKRTWFLLAVAAVAIAEPVLLLQASRKPAGFAAVVLGVQAIGALLAFALALRRAAPPTPAVSPEPA